MASSVMDNGMKLLPTATYEDWKLLILFHYAIIKVRKRVNFTLCVPERSKDFVINCFV